MRTIDMDGHLGVELAPDVKTRILLIAEDEE